MALLLSHQSLDSDGGIYQGASRQPGSAQLLRKDIWVSREFSGSDLGKPFQPSTKEARAHILR
jgi:hypothetical protein